MEIPNPIKVQVDVNFNFKGRVHQETETEKEEEDKTTNGTPVDVSQYTLDHIRATFHRLLIEQLQEFYGVDTWKEKFIQRAKEIHDYRIYKQSLTKFERGECGSENLLLVFIKDIYVHEKEVKLSLTKFGRLHID